MTSVWATMLCSRPLPLLEREAPAERPPFTNPIAKSLLDTANRPDARHGLGVQDYAARTPIAPRNAARSASAGPRIRPATSMAAPEDGV